MNHLMNIDSSEGLHLKTDKSFTRTQSQHTMPAGVDHEIGNLNTNSEKDNHSQKEEIKQNSLQMKDVRGPSFFTNMEENGFEINKN